MRFGYGFGKTLVEKLQSESFKAKGSEKTADFLNFGRNSVRYIRQSCSIEAPGSVMSRKNPTYLKYFATGLTRVKIYA